MGLFKSKKQKEEELLQLRQAKCEQLIKIGFFGISKTPLDVTTVAEHKAEVEADIMDYLIMQEQLMGSLSFLCQPGWAIVPRYLVKHYFRCFCQGVWGIKLTFKLMDFE